jgi:hypothetical protein
MLRVIIFFFHKREVRDGDDGDIIRSKEYTLRAKSSSSNKKRALNIQLVFRTLCAREREFGFHVGWIWWKRIEKRHEKYFFFFSPLEREIVKALIFFQTKHSSFFMKGNAQARRKYQARKIDSYSEWFSSSRRVSTRFRGTLSVYLYWRLIFG